jgi:hypothetical protein
MGFGDPEIHGRLDDYVFNQEGDAHDFLCDISFHSS